MQARGKAISSVNIIVTVIVVMDTKIAKSGDLGTWARLQAQQIWQKLAIVYLESSGTAYKHHKCVFLLVIIATLIGHAH